MAMSAAGRLEEILGRLLVPDNAVIQQATRELQAVYKDPAIISALCEILLDSLNPQVRQFAAILLRKRLRKLWKRLNFDEKQKIKALLLQAIAKEQIRVVLISISYLVGMIGRQEFTSGQWNELLQFINSCCNSQVPAQREGHFQQLIPKIMEVIWKLIAQDEDKACKAMELFDELVECEVDVVAAHHALLIQFCLKIAGDTSLGAGIRVKALSFLQWLAKLKKKSLLKQGLLKELLERVLVIMATPGGRVGGGGGGGEEEEEEEEEEEDSLDAVESHSPLTVAAQVLDVLALNLPPEKVFLPVLQLVKVWIASSNQFKRAAAIIALAVMLEGCSEYAKKNHLQTILTIVYQGTQESEYVVQNASLFALGQCSEYLQPEISQFHEQILPVLFSLVDAALNSQVKKRSYTKVFYAFETFCEQLGTKLLPYLPTIMEKLFLTLTSQSIHLRELAISSIGAVANACQENLAPYFQRIVEILKEYLVVPVSSDLALLQAQTVDTLGVLARTIGAEQFRPLAHECLILGMNLMQSNDPDLRRSVYGMFASVSCVLREDFDAQTLETIVHRMMESLQSEEGVKVHYASSAVPFLDFDDKEEEGEGEGEGEGDQSVLEDNVEIEGYSVENAYLEEKEDTCNALGELAENVGSHFLPFLDDCFKVTMVLTEHSAEGVKKAAITTQGRFCKLWYQLSSESEEKENLDHLINSTILNFAAIVRTDRDRSVAIAVLETLEDLLKFLKSYKNFVLVDSPFESVVVSTQDLLEHKAQCQKETENDEPPTAQSDDEMAEFDSVVVECAGSVIGPLAAIVGGERFAPFLEQLKTLLLNKLTPGSTTAEKSFVIGTLAEMVEGVGSYSARQQQLLALLPLFLQYLDDQDEEVCSNSIFGLGLITASGVPETLGYYQVVLQSLFRVSKTRSYGRIRDNICAAVCRMIVAGKESMPLNEVLPVVISSLPLEEDLVENETVYNCLLQLFERHDPIMLANLQPMLSVMSTELSQSSHLSEDIKLRLVKLLKALNSQYPKELEAATSALTAEQVSILTAALQLTVPV